MDKKPKKKVLVVLVDYSPTTLKAVKRLLYLDFDVTILVSYDFREIPEWFRYVGHRLFKKIYKRKKYVKDVLGDDRELVKVISGNFWTIWGKSIWSYLRKNIQVHNVHRQYVQHVLINQVNYNNIDAIYSFDTYSYNFQKKAKEHHLLNILQSRGMHFKYSMEVNKKLNQIYNTSVKDIDTYTENDKLYGWYNKLIAEPNLADFMVFYSEFHRKVFCEYSKIKTENSIIIPLPVGTPKSQKIIKLTGNTIKFLYVGNLSYVKGIPILLDAFKELQLQINGNKRVELHIFGKLLIKEIEQMLDNTENVFYHGVVENSKLMQRIQEFHVFVFPSLFDTFGMALAEALHNNLPVISNYTCGAAELYKENVHGLKCKDSYSREELMRAMEMFVVKKELVEEFSKNLHALPAFTEKHINMQYQPELQKLKRFIE